MKRYVRIGGAAVLGIGIILGALYVKKVQEAQAVLPGAIVSVAPEREYIRTTDGNGNGVEDWKESLSAQAFIAIDTPTSSLALGNMATYTPPTTFTDKFAEAFFTDYMEGKMNGTVLQNKDQLIGNALIAIDENTQSRVYTQADIVVVPDSLESIREYGNKISSIILRQTAPNENEMVIFQHAIETNDPATLKRLIPIRDGYRDITKSTLVVAVPLSLTPQHIALLNTYENILLDIRAMEQAFTDPLYALARIKRYQDDAKGLGIVLKNVSAALRDQGVTYAKNEPGTFFNALGF